VSSSQGACSFEHDGGHSTLVTEVQWQHASAAGFVKCETLLFDGYIALKGEAVFV
jgi:hypothetical protein